MAFSQEEMMELIAITWDRRILFFGGCDELNGSQRHQTMRRKWSLENKVGKLESVKNAETLEYILSMWHYVTSGGQTIWGLCRNTQNQHGSGIRILPDAKELALTFTIINIKTQAQKSHDSLNRFQTYQTESPQERSLPTWLYGWIRSAYHDTHRTGSVAWHVLFCMCHPLVVYLRFYAHHIKKWRPVARCVEGVYTELQINSWDDDIRTDGGISCKSQESWNCRANRTLKAMLGLEDIEKT